jgi:hypothetical protein
LRAGTSVPALCFQGFPACRPFFAPTVKRDERREIRWPQTHTSTHTRPHKPPTRATHTLARKRRVGTSKIFSPPPAPRDSP